MKKQLLSTTHMHRYRNYLSCLVLMFFISTVGARAQTTTYNYTGSMQTYIVPPGVTSVVIETWGAQGANANDRLTTNASGGKGSYAKGTLAVTPGQTLNIFVGGQGSITGTGGYNGGGDGGSALAGSSCSGGLAGGGGGASDVRFGGTALANRIIVAGGGGGAGRDYCNGSCQPCGCGGSGGAGDANGVAAGNCGFSYPGTGINFGGLGALVATANGGPGDASGNNGADGTLGMGGNGASGGYDISGGGGGGGYYGGGGGGGAASGSGVGGGGGGGGSSYVGGVTSTTLTSDLRTGNGMVTITAPEPAAITGDPVNTGGCAPASVAFIVSATNATGYQWQVNDGISWANVSNGGVYSGATTSVLHINGAPASMNGYLYRCVVSGAIGSPATSNSATLTVNSPVAISTQPATSTTVCDGDNVSYSVTATGTGLSYQWYSYNGSTYVAITNGGIYSGATTPTLNITGITTGINTTTYQYHCIVTGTCNLASTNTLLLYVKAKPTITSNPVNTTVCAGDDASFEVSATGPNHTFQWQVSYNGVNWANLTNTGGYADVTTSKMTVTTIPSMHGSRYRCVVSADCPPPATSGFATLSVNNALTINTQPVNSAICPGTGTSFFVTVTGINVTYQWQVLTGGVGSWTNVTNGGIYNGANSSNLQLTNVTAAYDHNKYRCVVNGDCSAATPSAEAELTLNAPVVITSQPSVNTTICSGGSTTYTVAATGLGLSYQWYVYNGTTYDPVTNGANYSGATAASLNINGLTATGSAKTYQYYCQVTGTCNSVATNTLLLNVNALPTVVTHPVNKMTCSGNDALFSVAATGTDLTYQWQISYNGNWANLTNSGGYVNVTTPNMTATTTQLMNGTHYRCIVSGACTPSDTSNSALLTIYAPLTIVTQPGDDTACPGSSISFRVIATGGSNRTYQWQESTNGGSNWSNVVNGGVYADATTNQLILNNVTTGMNNYMYRCLIDELCSPTLISGSGKLSVYNPVVITAEPAKNTTICSGDNVVYGIHATGPGLTYQWYMHNGLTNIPLTNGGIYSGVTTDTLRITGITAAPSAATKEYHCLVTGTCNSAATQTLILNINALPAITMNPVNDTACAGNDASFEITETGTGTSYQWQVSYDGTNWTNLTNTGGYDNVTTRIMKVQTIAGMDGSMYRCVVSGTCAPSVTSTPAKLKVYSPLSIVTQPTNESACNGTGTAFVITATGTNLTYQWQVYNGSWTNLTDGGIISGATTRILTLASVSPAMNNNRYRCMVNGKCSLPTASNEGVLTVPTPLAITNNGSIPVSSTICSGGSIIYSVNVTGSTPTYQWYTYNGTTFVPLTNGGVYAGVTTSSLYISGITAATTATNYQYYCMVTGPCNAVSTNTLNLLVNAKPAITMQPVNSTICEGSGTTYHVMATGTNISYQWQYHNGTVWVDVTNGGVYANATTNTLTIIGANAAMNDVRYRCVVSGTCTPSVSSDPARLYVNTAPVVIQNPYSSVICSGGNTSFAITATGTAPTYQWQVDNGSGWMNVTNGGIYTNATTSTLNLTGASASASGNKYRCMVSGTCSPATTSASATLTVNKPTAITSNPVNVTICENQTASFEVAATGTTLSYQWQENDGSGWATIANSGNYSGATTNKLVMVYVNAAKNTYKYRCIVGGVCAPLSVTSGEATLTVNSYTVITSQPTATTTVCSGGTTSLAITATGTGLTYQWFGHNGTSYVALTNTGAYSGVTTATLNISGLTATATPATYSYYCTITGACSSVSTNALHVQVNDLPAIVSNPVNVTTCDSTSNINFSVVATGAGRTYQWQVDNGSGWTNLGNGTNITGATTANLQMAKVYYSMNTNQYRCVVSGTCTPAAVSAAATLTVNPLLLPEVNVAANNANVCAGTLVTFTATPTNGGTSPAYQWKVNGVNAGTNSATFASATLSNTDIVACQMTSSYACPTRNPVNSNTVTMRVTAYQTPTAVVTSVLTDTVCSGVPDTFNVATTYGGTMPTYQWQVNGVDVASTAGNYVTDSLKNGDVVRCVVTSNFMCPTTATVSSNNVNMVVNQTTLATVSIASVADTSVCNGRPVTFTATGTNGGASPAYQWIRNGKDLFGETNQTYTVSNLQSNDELRCRYSSSAVCVFPVVSDTLHITVDQPVTATVDLKVSYNGNNSYTFTAQPVNGGNSPIYTWDLNGTTIPGVTGPVYTTDSLIVTDKVRVMMTSSHPCVVSKNVFSRRATTGIGGQESLLSDLVLYPNPNNGKFIITGQYAGVGSETAKVTIVNAMGQLIHTSEAQIVSGKLQHEVSLNGDPAQGMYILRIEMNGSQDISRFTITK